MSPTACLCTGSIPRPSPVSADRGGRQTVFRLAGFTLIEVLVVVAIIALLAGILTPALARARLRSRVVVAHSDLRQITLALDMYAGEHKGRLPPTRQSCGTSILYQLPAELAVKRYFRRSPDALQRSYFEDIFDRGQTYRYRAPGAVWQNGQLMDFPDSPWRPRASIWVPDDLPQCRSSEGRFYYARRREPRSPVAFAVWSVGPDYEQSSKLPRWEDGTIDQSRFPLQRSWWLTPEEPRSGLIVHYRTASGLTYTSP